MKGWYWFALGVICTMAAFDLYDRLFSPAPEPFGRLVFDEEHRLCFEHSMQSGEAFTVTIDGRQ
jgi:hypothetical protein